MRNTTRSRHSCRASSRSFSRALPPASSIPPIRECRGPWRLPAIVILPRASAWPIRPALPATALLAKLLGGPGKTSIRASYGMFYTAIEALTIGVMSANAPYGTTYTSPAPPLFSTPFVTAASGQNLGQDFPVTLAPLNTSASHPDPNINWAQFEPITGLPNYPTTNRIPYTEEYMLSLERGLGANTVLSLNYVGTQGHRLLVLEEANPGNPSLCLFLSNPANLAPGQVPCGPFGEDSPYVTSTGQVYNGTRGPLGSNFGSNANQATIGNSNYNALQVTLRHTSKRLNVLAGYTYSKSMDHSSNVGEEVNPLDPSLSKALSSFDVRHNFVVSYSYQIPFERLFHASNRWTAGLGTLRNHPFQHGSSRDPRQLRRQFSAGRRTEWHQQLWRGRAGLYGRASRISITIPATASPISIPRNSARTPWAPPAPPRGAFSTDREWTTTTWPFSKTCA